MRVIGVLMVLALGCGASAPVPSPQPVVTRYLSALERQDSAQVYALLSSERRGELSAAQLSERLADTREETAETVERLRDTGTPAHATAVVTLEDGETVDLVLEGGEWRIAAGVLDAAALRTPVQAVQSLRRALLRRDLAGLLSLLTSQERTSWEAAFGRVTEGTADPLDWDTEIRGDEATVRITGGGIIELRRESGRWRVHDIQQPPP